jgi:hypothetical protein
MIKILYTIRIHPQLYTGEVYGQNNRLAIGRGTLGSI